MEDEEIKIRDTDGEEVNEVIMAQAGNLDNMIVYWREWQETYLQFNIWSIIEPTDKTEFNYSWKHHK